MKKQVYKVGDRVQSDITFNRHNVEIREGDRGIVREQELPPYVMVYFYRTKKSYYMETREISPLKPKKSKKKMEKNYFRYRMNKQWSQWLIYDQIQVKKTLETIEDFQLQDIKIIKS